MQKFRIFLITFACSAAFLILPSMATGASGVVSASHHGYVYVRVTRPPVTAYLWASTGWTAVRPASRTRVWVQPYSGEWLWMYVGERWYAVDRDDVTRAVPTARRGNTRRKRAARARSSSMLAINSPATDNYKASFNAASNSGETRTWMNWTGVRIRGRVYRTVPGQAQITNRLQVRDSRGEVLTLSVRTGSANVQFLSFRVGPQPALAGVFMQLRSRASAGAPVRVRLIVETPSGRRVAMKSLYYRHDSALATAPAGTIEHNGPGGRWYIGSRRTRTNVEIGRR